MTLGEGLSILKEWQTLASGVIALLAAVPTILYLQKQVSVAERHETERRNSAERAARAVLPLALSSISDHIERLIRIFNGVYSRIENDDEDLSSWIIPEFPSLPDAAISSIQDVIATSTNNDAVNELLKIIHELQIQESRMKKFSQWSVDNLAGCIIELSLIYARCDSLFKYARGEEKNVSTPNLETVTNKLLYFDFDIERHPRKLKQLESSINAT